MGLKFTEWRGLSCGGGVEALEGLWKPSGRGRKFDMRENSDFFNEKCVSLVGGASNLICVKIVMSTFEVCYCGVGMLSTECPSS